jgi:hypothetical protein
MKLRFLLAYYHILDSELALDYFRIFQLAMVKYNYLSICSRTEKLVVLLLTNDTTNPSLFLVQLKITPAIFSLSNKRIWFQLNM